MGLGPFDSEIFPMVAVLKQYSPAAAESAGGFDHIMRERILVDGDADGTGEPPATLYGTEISVPAQFERQSLEALTMGPAGDLPESQILVSFSRGRLESLSLMDTDGRPKIKPGDRMVRVEDMEGNKVWTFDKPGAAALYCEQILLSDSYIGGTSNWFLATFKSRKQGPTP